MPIITNRAFEDIRPGDAASVSRTLTPGDLRAGRPPSAMPVWSQASVPGQAATGIASSLFAALAGSALPGPGAIIRSAAVTVHGPLPADHPLNVGLTVREARAADKVLILDARLADRDGVAIATGVLEVAAPRHPCGSRFRSTAWTVCWTSAGPSSPCPPPSCIL